MEVGEPEAWWEAQHGQARSLFQGLLPGTPLNLGIVSWWPSFFCTSRAFCAFSFPAKRGHLQTYPRLQNTGSLCHDRMLTSACPLERLEALTQTGQP